MMRTQAEAERTWCPHARISVNGGPAANKWEGNRETSAKCIGIRCSQWRLTPLVDNRDLELWSKAENRKVVGTTTEDADWRLKNPDEPLPERKGWCGLAGRPDE